MKTITDNRTAGQVFWQAVERAGDGGRLVLTTNGAIVTANTGDQITFEHGEVRTTIEYFRNTLGM